MAREDQPSRRSERYSPACSQGSGSGQRSHFAGALQGEALAAAYASADVFVFPSLTDTFGIVLLEAGPGQALTTLARQQNAKGLVAIGSQGSDADATDAMLEAAGRAWAAGLALNWSAIEDGSPHRRIALPTGRYAVSRFAVNGCIVLRLAKSV